MREFDLHLPLSCDFGEHLLEDRYGGHVVGSKHCFTLPKPKKNRNATYNARVDSIEKEKQNLIVFAQDRTGDLVRVRHT